MIKIGGQKSANLSFEITEMNKKHNLDVLHILHVFIRTIIWVIIGNTTFIEIKFRFNSGGRGGYFSTLYLRIGSQILLLNNFKTEE